MNISTLYKVAQPKLRKEIPSFALSPPPKLDNMFGMEVEVEGCRRFIEDYQAMLSPEWGVTQDNSLRNTREGVGLEFVSIPLTYTQLIQAVVKLYRQTGFKEDNFSDRCSIHVHANVTDFTQEQLSALALFYQAIEDVLFDFVGHYRETNIYCIPWSQCRKNHDLVTSIMDNGGVYKLKGWQKYTALNLLPILSQGTVEFRHMHGTANQDKICAWLTLLNNLISLSKEHTIESSINLVKSLSTEKDYSKFFSGIFGDILPFSDNYRGLLDTGVINAKYSMVNFGKKRSKVPELDPVYGGGTSTEMLDRLTHAAQFYASLERSNQLLQAHPVSIEAREDPRQLNLRRGVAVQRVQPRPFVPDQDLQPTPTGEINWSMADNPQATPSEDIVSWVDSVTRR